MIVEFCEQVLCMKDLKAVNCPEYCSVIAGKFCKKYLWIYIIMHCCSAKLLLLVKLYLLF